MIIADDKPFTEAESHFADAKFYMANIIIKELQLVVSSSTYKFQKGNEVPILEDFTSIDKKKGVEKNKKSHNEDKKHENKTSKAPLGLRYMPKLRSSEDQALKSLTFSITSLT